MTTWIVPAAILDWHDADTATVRADLGWGIQYKTRVRIEHCNAPELATPAGKAALAWCHAFLPPGLTVTLTSRKLEKYGRVLGSLTLPNGQDYCAALIQAGHAVPYEC